MKFKLDANIGVRGKQLLQAAGHDVATASEQGLGASPDAKLAGACATEQRVLVTLDTDFANPFVYPT
jgi:predicted nuclease of predicted toxin-antitoxin system